MVGSSTGLWVTSTFRRRLLRDCSLTQEVWGVMKITASLRHLSAPVWVTMLLVRSILRPFVPMVRMNPGNQSALLPVQQSTPISRPLLMWYAQCDQHIVFHIWHAINIVAHVHLCKDRSARGSSRRCVYRSSPYIGTLPLCRKTRHDWDFVHHYQSPVSHSPLVVSLALLCSLSLHVSLFIILSPIHFVGGPSTATGTPANKQ